MNPLKLCAVLVVAAAAALAETAPPPPGGSHRDLSCEECHKQGAIADCDACHDPKRNLHPIGMVPSMEIPKGFALGPGAKLLCRSCHRLHGGSPEARYVSGADTQPSDRTTFCSGCHGARMASSNPHAATGQANRCAYCHASAPSKTTVGAVSTRADIIKLCDFCHNVVAKDHPRNIDPMLSIPQGLPLLPDKSWSCVTCHNPHGTTDTTHHVRPQFARHVERGRQENTHLDSYFACKGCHTTSIADQIRPPGFSLRYRGDVTMLCISCHLTDKSHHPTGLALPPAISERMKASPFRIPLDEKGAITCYTCHDNGCSSGHQSMRERFYDGTSLNNDLCWICHDQAEFSRINPHVDDPALCVRCHETRPMADVSGKGALLASEKMVCLQCHRVKPHPASADHLRRPSAKIRPDDALPLSATGEVTCVTCHDPHAAEVTMARRLRLDTAELCGHCHWRR